MTEAQIAAISAQQEIMARDIGDIRGALTKMSDAMVALARIEERQAQDRGDIARLYRVTDGHGERINTLEQAQPLQRQTTKIVDKVIWVVVSMVLTAVLTTVIVKASFEARKNDVPQLAMPAR